MSIESFTDVGQRSEAANYSIRLNALHQNTGVAISGAIRVDNKLQMIEGLLPFQFECKASLIIVMAEPLSPDVCVSAELWSDRYGQFQQIGSCIARSVLIVEDVRGTVFPNSMIGGGAG